MDRTDRRRAPRLQVLDRIHGSLVSLSLPLALGDISPGGFSVESEVQFPLGARHLFRFTTVAGVEVVIEGAVAYSRRRNDSTFITGFRFVHSRLTDTSRDIKALLAAMDAELTAPAVAPSSGVLVNGTRADQRR